MAQLRYEWAMCHSNTFRVKPISKLLDEYVKPGERWLDPFANSSKRGTVTNDLNPKYNTDYHMDALDFLRSQKKESADGVLYDPPYNQEQAKRLYEGVWGMDGVWGQAAATRYRTLCKDAIAEAIKPNGVCISLGWNSTGLGAKRGFVKEVVLLVNHGGGTEHDTVIVAERKVA